MALIDSYNEDLLFRNNSSSSVFAGAYASTRNIFIQTLGFPLSDNGAGFQVKQFVSASAGVSRGAYFTPTLGAITDNDQLRAVSINPTFLTNGYNNIGQYSLHIVGNTGTDNIYPNSNNTVDVGSTALQYRSVNTYAVKSSDNLALSKPIGNSLVFSNGSNSTILGGFYPTTGNFFLRSSGSLPTDNRAGFQTLHNITAISGSATGVSFEPTLTASANSDWLVGVNINPSFNSGSYTNVINAALRVQGKSYLQNTNPITTSTYTIGEDGRLWNNVFTSNVDGGLSGSLNLRTNNNIGLKMISAGSRVMIQNGGTFNDSGHQFQVKGSTQFDGIVHIKNTTSLSSAAIFEQYATADEVINYRKLQIFYDTNTSSFNIKTTRAGTETGVTPIYINGLKIGAPSLSTDPDPLPFSFDVSSFYSNSGLNVNTSVAYNSANSGNTYLLSVFGRIFQSGTAGYSGIYESIFEDSVGSGTKYLINLGTNTANNNGGTHTSRFNITSSGITTVNGTANISGSFNTISSNTNILSAGTNGVSMTLPSQFFTSRTILKLTGGNVTYATSEVTDLKLESYRTVGFDTPNTIVSQRSVIFEPPFLASSSGNPITITNASTVYIPGAPNVLSNVTVTNLASLWVAAGVSRFGGGVYVTDIVSDSTSNKRTFSVHPTILQSGSVNYNLIRTSPFLSGSTSGTVTLLDLGTNSAANNGGTHTPVFTVSNTGLTTIKNIIDVYGMYSVVGADYGLNSRTNSTLKAGGIAMAHYTNSEEPVAIFAANSANGSNDIYFGGGDNVLNAGTNIYFYTAANGTTTNGSQRAKITSNGNFLVGTNTDSGEKLQVTGNSKLSGNVTSNKYYVSSLNTAPSTTSDTGTAGEIRFTSTGVFICTATNTWIKCTGGSF